MTDPGLRADLKREVAKLSTAVPIGGWSGVLSSNPGVEAKDIPGKRYRIYSRLGDPIK